MIYGQVEKGQISKMSFWCGLTSRFRCCYLFLCVTSRTAANRMRTCIIVYITLHCMLYIRNLYILLSSAFLLVVSRHMWCPLRTVRFIIGFIAHVIQFFFVGNTFLEKQRISPNNLRICPQLLFSAMHQELLLL